jgi:hypothetical protein
MGKVEADIIRIVNWAEKNGTDSDKLNAKLFKKIVNEMVNDGTYFQTQIMDSVSSFRLQPCDSSGLPVARLAFSYNCFRL